MPGSRTSLIDAMRQALSALAPAGTSVLLGTSGGPDSQAMLHATATLRDELGLGDVWALGVDHGTRPEALDELNVARRLAESLDIPFHIRKVQLPTGGNLLANARHARYAAMQEMADELGADHIAVAHTASDQAETLLYHLVRGTGLRGAGGMHPASGRLIRPLLEVRREEVMAYVTSNSVTFAVDPGNLSKERVRGRLRQDVWPALHAVNSEATRHMAEFCRWAREDEQVLDALSHEAFANALGIAGCLHVQALHSAPRAIQRRMLAHWLKRHDLAPTAAILASMQQGLEGAAGGPLRSSELTPPGHPNPGAPRNGPAWIGSMERRALRLEAGALWVESAPPKYPETLALPGEVSLAPFGWSLTAAQVPADSSLPEGVETVLFDRDLLPDRLQIRPWRQGDRFRPHGHPGSVKISDLFINEKIPRFARNQWPLVLAGQEVLWVTGLRRGSRAPITAQTTHAIQLALNKELRPSAC